MAVQINCPNCGTAIKDSMLGSKVEQYDTSKVKLINEFTDDRSRDYCTKCGKTLYQQALAKYNQEVEAINKRLQKLIFAIPLVSIHSPLNWDYEVIGLVTGQSTTGTGVISEITSSFTDLFGAQSGRFNEKLKYGEQLCGGQIRKQTLEMGGNAILGVDIDYADVGGDKGMLMVCMSGTAVILKNVEILGEKKVNYLKELTEANNRAAYLRTINNN